MTLTLPYPPSANAMPIVAIDPGTTESAFVVWVNGKVDCAEIIPNETMAGRVRELHIGCLLAIEQVESYGMAVGREVFETVWWAGRFAEAFAYRGGEFRMVPRRTVKLHLCNSARAKDANIRQALIDRFGPVGTKKAPGVLYGIASHKWAALALAVTVADEVRVEAAT